MEYHKEDFGDPMQAKGLIFGNWEVGNKYTQSNFFGSW